MILASKGASLQNKTNFITADFRYVRIYDLDISREKWLNYLQTVASDLDLHCLPVTLLGVS